MKKMTSNILATIFYILAAIFIVLGFNHILSYSNNKILGNHVNAYVGGDAYNYIINGTRSIAYFVLAVGFIIIATGCLLARYLSKTEDFINDDDEYVIDNNPEYD